MNIDVDAIEPCLNTDYEENVPHQEGIINELYERVEKKIPTGITCTANTD